MVMSTLNLEIQVTNLNEELGNLLLANFENYFPKQQAQELESKLWILNPFGSQNCNPWEKMVFSYYFILVGCLCEQRMNYLSQVK